MTDQERLAELRQKKAAAEEAEARDRLRYLRLKAKKAAALGDPDLPQVGDIDEYERSILETKQAEANAAQAQAAKNLEGAEDSLGENLLEGVGKAAATTNQLALEGVDFVTSPVRALFGGGSVMDVLGAVDPGLDPRNIQGPEEGYANAAATFAGTAPIAAAAVAPRSVEGATKVGDIMMDFVGAGSTESRMIGTNLAEQAALAKTAEQTMDARVLNDPTGAPNAARRDATGQYDFSTDEGVTQAAQDLSDELTYEANKIEFPEWDESIDAANAKWKKVEKLDKKIAKAEENGRTGTAARLEEEKAVLVKEVEEIGEAAPKYDPKVRSLEVLDELETRYGLNPVEAQKQISRQGGYKPAKGFDEIRERVAAKNAIDYDGDGEVASWLGRTVRPVSEVVANSVGGIIGRKFENAFETATRNSELLTSKYLKAPDVLTKVTKWAEQPEVKAAFLDLRTTGAAGRGELLARAGKELGAAEVRMLDEMFKDAAAHQKEGARLFRKDVRTDEVYWPSAIKMGEEDAIEGLRSEAGQRNPKSVTSAGPRDRKLGSDMEAEELGQYESPVTALITRMAGEQSLLQLAKQFELPPSLTKNESTDEFFDALEAKFAKESGDASKARIGRNLIEETYRGTRKSPAKGVELFMKQSYAGTLGQLDSAILNLHDIAVSMMRNGTKPTLRALMDRGFDPREFGITNTNKSMGEFREGFDGMAERGMLEKGFDWYQDKAFKFSGFQDMDRFGKGTVLKAAWNMAQDSASNGTLMQDFGYMMKPKELAQINKVLKNKTPLKDMTETQRELVTQLMFSRLGEQQLISAAGRPLEYLKNPNFRFMYAMTGFAIKQAEMMKKGVLDNVAKGDYKAAGEFAFRYMLYAGVGYGIVNQARGSIQYAMGNEDKKPSWAGFAGDVISQPAAAVTFNRISDSYSVDAFKRNWVGASIDSLKPPGGLIENVAKDMGSVLSGSNISFKTLNSVPGGDELRAYLNN
jgi:hypothetical protein